MKYRIIALVIDTVFIALLAGVVGGMFAAHRERISSLEQEVQQLK